MTVGRLRRARSGHLLDLLVWYTAVMDAHPLFPDTDTLATHIIEDHAELFLELSDLANWTHSELSEYHLLLHS